MENQNIDNQPNQVKRNPTRFNTNVKEGKTDEKTFGAQTGQNRDVEINPAELDSDEVNLDRSGIDTTPGAEDADFSGGEETKQADGQIDGEQIQEQSGGSSSRVTESEISHKGQVGGQHASSMGNIQKEAKEIQKQASRPGEGQTYGQKDREKIPSVDQEGRIIDQNIMNRGMDQNRNGNQQGSQFNQQQ